MSMMLAKATKGIDLHQDEETNSGLIVESSKEVLKWLETTRVDKNTIFTLYESGGGVNENMTIHQAKDRIAEIIELENKTHQEKLQVNTED